LAEVSRRVRDKYSVDSDENIQPVQMNWRHWMMFYGDQGLALGRHPSRNSKDNDNA
jgi:hypothetical protein